MNEAPQLPDKDEWSRNQYNPTDVSTPIHTIIEMMGEDMSLFNKLVTMINYSDMYAAISGQAMPSEKQLEGIAEITNINVTFWKNRFSAYHENLDLKANQFLAKIRGMQDKDLETIAWIYSEVYDWLADDNYPLLSAVIKYIKIDDYTTDVLVTLLTVSNKSKEHGYILEGRKEFFEKCSSLIRKRGHYEEGLFGGLEE